MKKYEIVTLFCIQIFTVVILLFTLVKTQDAIKLITTTRKSLDTTIKVMNDINKQNESSKTNDSSQPVPTKPITVDSKAPNFSLKDENNNVKSLKDYKGKKIVLVISDPQCESCKIFYPILNKFIASNSNIQVLIMLIETTPEQNKLYKKEYKINSPLLATPAQEIMTYGITNTPTSIVINPNGVVKGVKVCRTQSELENLVKLAK